MRSRWKCWTLRLGWSKGKMTVDGTGSCIGEKINPPAESKAGIRKLGYVRVAQRLDQALRGQNYKIFWIWQNESQKIFKIILIFACLEVCEGSEWRQAELNLGFWNSLYETHHYALVKGVPCQIFKSLPSGYGRKEVNAAIQEIRTLRHSNDPLYRPWEEDGVCGREFLKWTRMARIKRITCSKCT